jgi:hypothetical protein
MRTLLLRPRTAMVVWAGPDVRRGRGESERDLARRGEGERLRETLRLLAAFSDYPIVVQA